jgi:hypothetical protein
LVPIPPQSPAIRRKIVANRVFLLGIPDLSGTALVDICSFDLNEEDHR